MAKVKQLSNVEMILRLLQESLQLANDEYKINPSNPLSSVIVDLELTIIELKKIKTDGLTA
jgi:hypothetical protein